MLKHLFLCLFESCVQCPLALCVAERRLTCLISPTTCAHLSHCALDALILLASAHHMCDNKSPTSARYYGIFWDWDGERTYSKQELEERKGLTLCESVFQAAGVFDKATSGKDAHSMPGYIPPAYRYADLNQTRHRIFKAYLALTQGCVAT